MQYVISDTHLMDENLLGMDEFAPRPFATTAAMDQAIIDHWNARVKPTDVVYHLGDIAVDLHRYPLLLGIAPRIRNLHGHIHHYQLPYATNLNVGVDAPELNFLAQPVPFGTPLSMAEVETIAAKKATWLAAQQQGKE